MTVTSPIRQMLAAIKDADMGPIDRELMRIPFAQLEAGVQEIHMPERVVARVRDIYARKQKS